jgi:hypothetical protein
MSNLLNAISDGLNGDGVDLISELTGSLGLQVDNLSGLGDLFNTLMSDPEALTDLVRNLDEMDLPSFDLDSGFGEVLGSLQSVLPDDVGNILGPLLDGLDDLEGSVIGNLANVVTQSAEAARAIYTLTQISLLPSTNGSSSSSGGSDTDGSDDGAAGGEGLPPGEGAEPEGGAPAEALVSTAQTLESIDRFLDILPEQASVRSAVEVVAKAGSKRSQLSFKIPMVDELGDMVQTLLSWEEMDAAAVHAQLDATLQNLTTMLQSVLQRALEPSEASLAALQSSMRVSDLESITDTLQSELATIAAAVTAEDLSAAAGAVSALNSACDLHDAVAADWSASVSRQLSRWREGMTRLPEDLEDQLAHRMQLLRPVNPLGHLLNNDLPAGWTENQEAMDAFSDQLDRYVAWLWDLVNRIDLQAIEAPLIAIADGAQAAVDGLDDAMVAVTMQVQSLFSEAEALMDQVNVEAVTQTLVSAIDDFGDDLVTQLQELTAPIRDGVESLITGLQGSLSDFDPTAVQDACNDVMSAVSGVLNNESLQRIADTIRNAIETAAAGIDELSFAPVADLVVAAIEEVTEALQSIDASELDPILSAALDAAVELLPQDIAALTDPLIDELGRLIEEEAPLPQLTQVLQKPQEMLSFVRQYEPRALLGNALSGPFETLLETLETFQPSTMLCDPINQVLETLKSRLEENANPAMLLDPLIPLFDELLDKMDALQPAALIAPIEARMQALIDNLLEALNIDDIMGEFDALINKIQDIFDLGDRARQILQRLSTMAEGLLDAETQFSAWLDPIFDKLDLPGGDGPLSASQAALAAAVEALDAGRIQQRFDDAVNPVLEALQAINGAQLLVPAVQAYRAVSRDALETIEGFDAEKASILAVLDRCNPMQAAFASPFQGLADFISRVQQTRSDLSTKLGDWNERWMADDSALAELSELSVSGDGLRNQLTDTVQKQIVQPFTPLFNMAGPLRDGVAPIISSLERVMELLQTKIENALLGEDGLGGIRTAMDRLIDRIDNFDLSFLTDSLQELFDHIKGKLQALSPQVIRDVVDAEFRQLLDAVNLDLILPPQDPDPLDTIYEDLVSDFSDLHPDVLVVQPLQQTFDQDVMPLLEVFDLTPVIQELLDKLAGMDEELKEEMQRVNGAYDAMLQAVP